MNKFIVSCIIIGKDIEKYIGNCIDSVIAQDYQSIEIIYVDDGSTDKTFEIAKSYISDKFKCFQKENGGIISARTYGVNKCHGDYVCFIDGDDYIDEKMISSMIKEIDKSADSIDILKTDQWNQGMDGQFYCAKSASGYGYYSGEKWIQSILADKMLHHVFPHLYRREFLIKSGYIDYPRITTGEDLLTNVCLGLHNPVIKYVNQTHYYYKMNMNSVTRKENPTILQQVDTLKLIEDYFKANNRYNEFKSYLDYSWYSYSIVYIQSNYSYRFKYKLISECKDHLSNYKSNPIYLENRKCRSKLADIIFDSYFKSYWLGATMNYIADCLRFAKRKVWMK